MAHTQVSLRKKWTYVFLSLVAIGLMNCGPSSQRRSMDAKLCNAETLNKNYVLMDTLTGIEEMLTYFMSNGSQSEKIRANYMMGCVYRDRGDSPRALQSYLDAVALADTTSAHCDFASISRIYAQMGGILHQQQYYQRELTVWQTAASLAYKANDTLMLANCLQYMAGAYYEMHDSLHVMSCTVKARDLYLNAGHKDLAAAVNGMFIDHYLARGEFDKLKENIDEYIHVSGLVDSDGNAYNGNEMIYYYLGVYYQQTNQLDSALWCFRKVLSLTSHLLCTEFGYRGMMMAFGDLHNTDSVIKYARLYADANDTSHLHRSIDEVCRVQALYDYTEYQQAAVRKAKETSTFQRLLFLLIIGMLIIAALSYYYIKRRNVWIKTEISQTNRAYNDTLLQLDKARSELLMLRTNQRDLEQQKQKEIERLKQIISAYQNNINEELWETEQGLQQHKIIQNFHKYATRGIMVPTTAEWKDFEDVVKKMLPEFYTHLSPYKLELSEREFYVCLLTRVNFIPTEIAALMNYSKQRVSNLRGSANLKVFGNHSSKSFDANIHRL